MRVAILGCGLMGAAMARAMSAKGVRPVIWNRTESTARALAAELNADQAVSPADAARQSDVILQCVTDPQAAEAVALGHDGAVHGLRTGSAFAEMSTITPACARRIVDTMTEAGVLACHAPVIGNAKNIAAGTLRVFTGGDSQAIDMVEPVWRLFCDTVWRFDTPEQAAVVKLSVNMMIPHLLLGMAQSMRFAAAGGLSGSQWLEILQSTAMACPMWTNKGPKLLAGDFTPNFTVANMAKDLDLMLQTGRDRAVPLPFTALIAQLFQSALNDGLSDADYSAVACVLDHSYQPIDMKENTDG